MAADAYTYLDVRTKIFMLWDACCIIRSICFRPIEQKSIQLIRYTQVNKQTNKLHATIFMMNIKANKKL